MEARFAWLVVTDQQTALAQCESPVLMATAAHPMAAIFCFIPGTGNRAVP